MLANKSMRQTGMVRSGLLALCIALVGCAPGIVTSRSNNARLVEGPPIQDITTPFDTALSCLSGKIPANATFAVAAIADNTGKEQYADSGTGKMVTQGAGDMVQSALFQAGVRVVNRRDPNIPIAESNWGLRNMGDQTAADFFISGSINSLDYIPGGGASVKIAGVGPEFRQTRILIGMDLALTNSFNGEVIANIPLQKQIAHRTVVLVGLAGPVAQAAPEDGVVDAVRSQQFQNVFNQGPVQRRHLTLRRHQAQFGAHSLAKLRWKYSFVRLKRSNGEFLLPNQRQQSLPQAVQVPVSYIGLLVEGIAPLVVGVIADVAGVEAI